MTTVFCPTRYNAQFATLHYTGEFGWQLTAWEAGRAKGHKWFETAMEAALQAAQLGLILASAAMRQAFEEDVILAAQSR